MTTTKSATAIVYIVYVFAFVILFTTGSLFRAIGAFLLCTISSFIVHRLMFGVPLFCEQGDKE